MSTLTLTLRQGTHSVGRISLDGLTPTKLSALTGDEISNVSMATSTGSHKLGDLFFVDGSPSDILIIAGGGSHLDDVATDLDAGTLIVEGDIGSFGGRRMSGGRFEIKGNAGPLLGSGLSGGIITVAGSAGAMLGGIKAGEKFGMVGGTVVVEGDIGPRAGDRMRRGTIIARGKIGDHAGSRMMGGTIWTETGFGAEPGPMLRRGTLIAPAVEKFLPTFVDAGRHDLVVLGILTRYLQRTLGALAPKALPAIVRKFSGDMATIGKGEILLLE